MYGGKNVRFFNFFIKKSGERGERGRELFSPRGRGGKSVRGVLLYNTDPNFISHSLWSDSLSQFLGSEFITPNLFRISKNKDICFAFSKDRDIYFRFSTLFEIFDLLRCLIIFRHFRPFLKFSILFETFAFFEIFDLFLKFSIDFEYDIKKFR